MCDNFLNKIKKMTIILTYDLSSRIYYLGQVIGDYKYGNRPENPHARSAKLDKTISSDLISNGTKTSLGSLLIIFKMAPERTNEILKLFEGDNVKERDEAEIIKDNIQFSNNLIEKANKNLKDSINSLSHDDMEEPVKKILKAMGRAKKGADIGVDFFASKDELGLEVPLNI